MKAGKYNAFDDLIEGVQIINNRWQYIYVNNSLATQYKSTKGNLLGKTIMEKYPGIQQKEIFTHIENCMYYGTPCEIINKCNLLDGSKGYFQYRIQRVADGVIIFSFDITEKMKIEGDLHEINEKLETIVLDRTKELVKALEREKELNQMKSRFVSMASHEFRTPLSTILSSISLIEQYTEPEQSLQRNKHIERIKYSVRNLNEILNNFLSLSRLEQGKMEMEKQLFDLPKFVNQLSDEISVITKEGQQIIYNHLGDILINFDKQIMRSVLLNFLSNAIKYSDKDILVSTNVNDKAITISIKDSGIGIPPEEQNQLFNGFFRAKNAQSVQGTGLGLNIVKKYVELLKGSITFNSEPGEGTVFIVSFPNVKKVIRRKHRVSSAQLAG